MNNLLGATQATGCRTAALLRILIALFLSALAPAAQGAPSIRFVTGTLPGSLRNDISALLGMKFTVGSEDLTVTHLGRLYLPGNSAAHTLKLVQASDQTELGSITVQLPGAVAGQFEYAALSSPVTLLHGNSYFLVSEEVQNGDQFYNIDAQGTTRPVATIDCGVVQGGGYVWWSFGSPGNSFGLVDFKFVATASIPLPVVRLSSLTGNPFVAPTSLTLHAEAESSVGQVEFFDGNTKLGEDNSTPFSLTWSGAAAGPHTLRVRGTDRDGLVGEFSSFSLNVGGGTPSGEVPLVNSFVPRASRNDFTGLLGMELVVGSQPLTLTALGRFHLPGNSGTHLVKLVRSSDYLDVPGATATVALNSPGQFQYAPLPTPVTLIPNGRYILVSEETAGGDAFYDFDTALTPGPGGSISGSAYTGSGYPWAVVHEADEGYGPLNLKYAGEGGPVAPSVSITAPSANATFTQPSSILIEAFASAGVNLVKFYDQGVKLGQASSPPYQFQWFDPPLGTHQLTAVASDHGQTVTSTPITITVQSAAPPATPPIVSLSSPIANSILVAPAQISLEAAASTNTTQVQFFADDVLLGTDTTKPFSVVWNNPAAGVHALKAIATASGGLSATSAPISITVASVASSAGHYIQNTLPGTLRQDWNGWIGYRFTVKNQALQVTGLGRYIAPLNTRVHQLKLVRASDGQDMASVSLATLGALPGQYQYATLAAPVTLNTNTSYYLVTEELNGADYWHDSNTGLSGQSIASLDGPVYFSAGWMFADTPDHGFGPVDFQFTAAPAPQPPTVSLTVPANGSSFTNPASLTLQATASASAVKVEFFDSNTKLGEDTSSPFSFVWNSPSLGSHSLRAIATAGNGLTATSGPVQITVVAPPPPVVTESGGFIRQLTVGTPRNDFTGWVGYKFTTANNSVPVSHLGRFVFSGNTGNHTVRLVRASDGVELGSVNLALAGASTNQFLYGALTSSITLGANTAYYLASQESSDSWSDADAFFTPASIAAINGPVYIGTGYPSWVVVESPNHGFGPLDFLYGTNSVPPPQPPTVNLTSPANGSSFTNPASITLQATASASAVKVEFFDGNTKLGEDTSSPFSLVWNSPSLGSHSLRTIATAGNGLTATSGPVQISIVATSAPPPTVTLTAPSNGSTHTNPASLTLQATASASAIKVEFFDNTTKLGEDASSPFAFAWNAPALGAHNLKAIATDSGGLTGTSGPVQITIVSSGPAPPLDGTTNNFVMNKQLGTGRNNYDGFLGMAFTVGAYPITVTELARLHSQGNTQTHTVKLVQANGTDVSGGAVQISMAGGTPGTFIYGRLPASITLAANTTYFLVSQETAGGDRWYDVVGTYITGSGVASVDSGIYGGGGSAYVGGGLPGQSFIPVDFKYLGSANTNLNPTVTITSPNEGTILIEPSSVNIQASASVNVTKVEFFVNGTKMAEDTNAPFSFSWSRPAEGGYTLTAKATDGAARSVTSAPVHITVTLTPTGTEKEFIVGVDPQDPRSTFDGYLGMEITIGADPITVTHLGRYVLPGNSRSHQLKIVNERDGTDIPGAATSVSLAGATVGQFAYAALPAPITLQAHELYFIVCQEAIDGDNWCDVTRTMVTNAAVASVDGGVYGAPWHTGGLPHHSFGPVGFKFLGGDTAIRPSISITSPAEGATFLVPVNIEIGVEARGGITRVEFYRDNQLLGSDNTSPFSLTWTNPVPGHYALTTRGYTDSGLGATSGIVNVTVATNLAGLDRGFVVSRTAGKLRHNFTGYIGMQFTLGDLPIVVTELGREFIEGNSATRLLKLLRTNNTEIASVSLNMIGGSPNQFRYAALASPVTLDAHTTYYLVSQETIDGDLWQDFDTVVTTTTIATVDGGIYSNSNPPWKLAGIAGNAGGPVNFRYHLANGSDAPTLSFTSLQDGATVITPGDVSLAVATSAGVTNVEFFSDGTLLGQDKTAPFSFLWSNPPLGSHQIIARGSDRSGLAVAALIRITVNPFTSGTEYHYVQSVVAGPARNDFNGYLGMTFTVGSTPLTIVQLGRMHVSSNSATHLLRLVRGADRHDVASVSVSMAGGTPGQFRYAPLTTPITLAANTIYHLVSEEQLDGDTWLDVERTALTTTPVATLDSGVFGSGGTFTGGGLPNHSYVPLDFVYVFATPPPAPTISFSNPTNNSTIIAPSVLLLETTVASSVTRVEFFANNVKLGEDTTIPFNYSWAQPVVGTHQLKAIATSALGLMATSTVVQVTIQAGASDNTITSTPFIVTANPGQPRSDFTGFLGMEISVGTNPVTVTHLGRMKMAGNSQAHLLKFVRWSTGQDVPGSTVSVDLSTGVAGQFKYQALASPVILDANTIYRLVSQETTDGDQWYGVEQTTVVPTSVATVDAGVYGGPPWVAGGLPNHSYGPLNFQYVVPAQPKKTPMLTLSRRSGLFELSLVGEGTVRLEASRDFITWTSLGTFTLSTTPQTFQDPTSFQTRFYRIVPVP